MFIYLSLNTDELHYMLWFLSFLKSFQQDGKSGITKLSPALKNDPDININEFMNDPLKITGIIFAPGSSFLGHT